MAHFAEIDKNNVVLRVIVVNNEDTQINGVEDEMVGIVFCKRLLGGNWVQTSYNGNIRKRYAGIGYTYDEANDVFIAPQPYPSWALDRSFDWQPPTPCPDGFGWIWDEVALSWRNINA